VNLRVVGYLSFAVVLAAAVLAVLLGRTLWEEDRQAVEEDPPVERGPPPP
jgi:hypothetical protein